MKKWLQYLVLALCNAGIVLLVLFAEGSFSKTGVPLLTDLSSGFFAASAMTIGLGLLIFCTNGGTFDMIAFGVIKLFDLFKKDLTKVKYRTFYDYRKAQQEKKRNYGHYLVVGGVMVVCCVLFLILSKTL